MPFAPPRHQPPGHAQAKQAERKAYEQRRGNRHERGYDDQWYRFRKIHAGVVPAICVECGFAGASEDMQLDHIVPLTRGGAKYDRANLQWLCRSCHWNKTVKEDRK